MTGIGHARKVALILSCAAALTAAPAGLAAPPAEALGTVTMVGCQQGNSPDWKTTSNGGNFGLIATCPYLGNLDTWGNGFSLGGGSAGNAQYATWFTSVPAGMQLTSAGVEYFARDLGPNSWAGDWVVGGQLYPLQNTSATTGMAFGAAYPGLPSIQGPPATGTLFGWTIQCRSGSGCSNNGDMIQVAARLFSIQRAGDAGPVDQRPERAGCSDGLGSGVMGSRRER